MIKKLSWETKKVKVCDLIPLNFNPRKITEDKRQKLIESLEKFNLAEIPAVNTDLTIIGGNQRVFALHLMGRGDEEIDVRYPNRKLSEKELKEYAIISNTHAGEWDMLKLEEFFDDVDFDELGFDMKFDLFEGEEDQNTVIEEEPEAKEDDYEIPEEIKTDIVLGDLFEIGVHRLLCGDSTCSDTVAKLMNGEKADLIHADPPYGMGKEKDGVENDNLYKDQLNEFQLLWISQFLKVSSERASLYIWGNPEPLWSLWFKAGLHRFEKLTLKNQIVWDKKNIAGMASPLLTMYPIASEHCLFIQRGEQWRGNINSDDFWEGFEEVRSYLSTQADINNIKASDILNVCGVGMYSHWFTKSQWTLIPKNQYTKIQEKYPSFRKPWEELKKLYDKSRKELNLFIQSDRAYFNNSHDSMTDVWDFKRVLGDERHGHATPKPITMMHRIIKSSSNEGELVAEPFLGSGSTMVAAHQIKRKCYGMELSPKYCQVIVDRMRKLDPSLVIKRNGEVWN
jgi:DNA modification methylase